MKAIHIAIISGLLAVLTGCGIGGMAGPFPGHSEFVGESTHERFKKDLAPPQVVYRIDENRYFEYVPYDKLPCARAELFYTDKEQGIHTQVALTGNLMTKGSFIIDAENTDYLVGPIIRANGNCGADTVDRPSCSSRLPYSTDGGRSWKYVPTLYIDSVLISQESVYVGTLAGSHSKLNLSKPELSQSDWIFGRQQKIDVPAPHKISLDTQFHCNSNLENGS